MKIVTVLFAAFLGGAIQSITGFGSAIILMLILPELFGMLAAPALTGAINIGLSAMLTWRFRKRIRWKSCIVPIVSYLVCSLSVISLVKNMDLKVLTVFFGVFLIALALYSFLKPDQTQLRPTPGLGCLCGAISGLCSGFFGIGGPMMAIYFMAVNREKETYLGNINFLFATTNIVNLGMRAVKGIYTADLIPFTLLGIAGAFLGKLGGLRVMEKLNPERLRRIVYMFVAVAGVIMLIQELV